MSLGLHNECQKSLVEKIASYLPTYVVVNGNVLVPTDFNTLGVDAVLPKAQRDRLTEWVTDTPVIDFVTAILSRELSETQPYKLETSEVRLTDLDPYQDTKALAQRLTTALDTLPWEYALSLCLPERTRALLPLGGDLQRLSQNAILLKSNQAFAQHFPLRSGITARDEILAPQIPLPFYFGFPPPLPAHWDPSDTCIHLRLAGFVGPVTGTATLHDATCLLKTILGLAVAFRRLTHNPQLQLQPTSPSAQFIIHRRTAHGWEIEGKHQLPQRLSTILADLEAPTPPQSSTPAEVLRAGSHLRWISTVLTQPAESQKIALASQWLLDSHGASDELLAFVQTTVAMEILLGDKSASDLMGVSALLRNRCAYLIANTLAERQELLANFEKIYDVRSRIVHRGQNRLTREERELLWELRRMCHRAIQEEVFLLEAGTQSPES